MLTMKQRQVLVYLRNVESATLQQIIDNTAIDTFYCNGNKHCGNILSRMVKQNLIERVKKGTFKIKLKPLSLSETINIGEIANATTN